VVKNGNGAQMLKMDWAEKGVEKGQTNRDDVTKRRLTKKKKN